jgi:hypothetical protein
VCCSSAKERGNERHDGPTILEHLPSEIAADLATARERVAPLAGVDDTFTLPAWCRYSGGFYRAAEPALQNAIECRCLPLDRLGRIRRGPRRRAHRLLQPRVPAGRLAGFDRSTRTSRLRGSMGAFFGRRDRGSLDPVREGNPARSLAGGGSGSRACQSGPSGGGARTVVPRTAGDAFRAAWEGGLPVGWRSSSRTPVLVEQLR